MFVLPFDIPKSEHSISLQDPIFSIGSCFADNIGEKLADNKFDVEINPLGTIYNPYSIFKNIHSLLSEGLAPDNYIKSGDVFYHWDTHSAISSTNYEAFSKDLRKKSTELKNRLHTCKWLIVTLGTAKVYRYKGTEEIVANCHKVPGKEFEQSFLQPKEITEQYFKAIDKIRSFNPDVHIILSVSPVRHIRDGLVENNYSKSILLQAVREITTQDERASYFPAYELMIDVLRDYRFYQPDMIHPTAQAVDYIWEHFTKTFMDDKTQQFITQWAKIRRALAHRPFHSSSSGHQTFLQTIIKQLKALESKVDVSSEITELEKQLI